MKRKKGAVMPRPLYNKIIKEVAENSPEDTIVWHAFMGEPTLAEDLADRIIDAKALGIRNVWLNTNATQDLAKVLAAGPDKIIVSLDAYSEEAYSRIRCGGDFAKVVGNVKFALEHKSENQEIMVQFVSHEHNMGELMAFKKFWLSAGATVKARRKLGWGRSVDGAFAIPQMRTPCGWLMRQMVILNDGTVAQCDADYEGGYCAGNINTRSIRDIWMGELKKRRDKHLSGNFDFEPCNRCDDWQVGRSEICRP
jgi:radical SAM protein with 4Fe4S-binding SPASM domain